MSGPSLGDAWEHSPFTEPARFVVHLAIADVVNDVNDNKLWMRRAQLVTKARASRGTVDVVLAELVKLGWLVPIGPGGGRGKPTEYHYHPGGKPPSDDAVCGTPETAQPVAQTAQPDESSPTSNEKNSTRKPRTGDAAHELTAAWWEALKARGIRPMQANAFVAVRQIVQKALAAEWTRDEIAEGLRRLDTRAVTAQRLNDACYGIRREAERDNPAATPFWKADES